MGWTTFSDGRYKKNIKEDVQGLAFINKLRPVTYSVNTNSLNDYYNEGRAEVYRKMDAKQKAEMQSAGNEASKIIYNGFIAQEVETAAQKLHYNFSGIDKPKSDNGLYGLRYGDFVVPLVKAVQELSKQNDSLKARLEKIEQMLATNNIQQNSFAKATIALNSAQLYQNSPNPFTNTTTIQYNIPGSFKSARIAVTDINGKTIKQVPLNTSGKGTLNINAYNLSNGTYSYSLIIDGKNVESKKMVVEK